MKLELQATDGRTSHFVSAKETIDEQYTEIVGWVVKSLCRVFVAESVHALNMSHAVPRSLVARRRGYLQLYGEGFLDEAPEGILAQNHFRDLGNDVDVHFLTLTGNKSTMEWLVRRSLNHPRHALVVCKSPPNWSAVMSCMRVPGLGRSNREPTIDVAALVRSGSVTLAGSLTLGTVVAVVQPENFQDMIEAMPPGFEP